MLAYIMLEILEDVYMYLNKYVTKCEKIGLICTQNTPMIKFDKNETRMM